MITFPSPADIWFTLKFAAVAWSPLPVKRRVNIMSRMMAARIINMFRKDPFCYNGTELVSVDVTMRVRNNPAPIHLVIEVPNV